MKSFDLPKLYVFLNFCCLMGTCQISPPFPVSRHSENLQVQNFSTIQKDQLSFNSTIKEDVKCYLFISPKKKLNLNNRLVPEYFDPKKKTKIITHGWMNSMKDDSVTLIQNAYLKKKKYNVVSCDWSPIAKNYWYPAAAFATEPVGIYIGKLIKRLVRKTKTKYSKIHFIGHSLGAHVASCTGKVLNGSLGRITCLDPAAPCFEDLEPCFVLHPLTNISPSDARFVDAIHTCAGVLGLVSPVGHADFYPNGGGPIMPGCFDDPDPINQISCSHFRSFQFYAESVDSQGFKALKCDNSMEFILGGCEETTYTMGDMLRHDSRGSFYLATASHSPFALGQISKRSMSGFRNLEATNLPSRED